MKCAHLSEALLVAVVLSVASCGSNSGGGKSGGASCALIAACGGNLVGTWKVAASCYELSGALGDSACPTATVSGSLQITGTMSFSTALSYVISLDGAGAETIHFPASCLTSAAGVVTSCAQLNQAFAANPPDPSIKSINCTAAGGGACDCAAMVSGLLSAESGTYSTSGSVLTTTPPGGTADTANYCVKGTTLDVLSTSADLAMNVSADLTLTRQ